ncbi:MAG: DUF429 domain-containing protein [Ktedonobacteraceae bacterium]|nr:DUF429 domain-containing protein [Ktedonobacteraceae bacterium]
MRVFGLDFTSAPGHRKPITCACCELDEHTLTIRSCQLFTTFIDFEHFLCQDGPWIAALDFPFGQPHKLIVNLHWPQTWEGYVQHIAALGKAGFEESIQRYRDGREMGDKLHRRVTDIRAGAISPMMLHRIPVGKMFFEGAPRLLATDTSILPCRPTASEKIVLEGYPSLVARKGLGRQSYKSDERKKQTEEHLQARQKLVGALRSDELLALYGLKLDLSEAIAAELVGDPMGDKLDAVLCAIQAGWSYMRRDQGYGIPSFHKLEGWIVDPEMSALHVIR